MSLWDFAVRTWEDERVQPALLALQEGAGQCVPLLLWSLWILEDVHPVDAETLQGAVKLALPWHIAAEEMRAARRRLREVEADEGLLEAIQNTTLAAERELLHRLEAFTPAVRGPEPETRGVQLSALIAAWGRPVAPHLLEGLLAALEPDPNAQAPGDNDDDQSEPRRLRELLASLKDQHAKLSAEVEALTASPAPDQLHIARMKRRKLALRDEIVAIEDRLTPDIIA